MEGKNSSEESSDDDEEEMEESSDDDHTWTKDVKKQHRIIQREHRRKELEEEMKNKEPKLYELKQGEEFKGVQSFKRKLNKYVILTLKIVVEESKDKKIISLFAGRL